jgi:glycosyltransferase involved in cell wall biosynthesis
MAILPLVTIVVPNYNHGRFLAQRLNSILTQTFQDFELIILDDASTDNSRDVIEEFRSDSRVRVIYNKPNSGSPFLQWNRGVGEACGEFVWIAESDDYADPTFLQQLVTTLEDSPAVGVAYSQSWHVDDTGAVLGTIEPYYEDLGPGRWRNDYVNSGTDECARYLVRKNTLPNASAVVFRRKLYDQVGGAEVKMRLAGDWMLWAKLLLRSHIAFKAQPLNYYRHHASTVRKSLGNTPTEIEESYRVATYIARNVELSASVKKLVRRTLAARLLTTLSTGGISAETLQILRTARQFDRLVLWSLFRRTLTSTLFRLLPRLKSSRLRRQRLGLPDPESPKDYRKTC